MTTLKIPSLRQTNLILLALILMVIGLIPVKFGYQDYERARALLRDGTVTDAVVDDYVIRNHDGAERHYPIVRFTDDGGVIHRVEVDMPLRKERFKRGVAVELLFDPRRPDQTVIMEFFSLWWRPALWFGLGIPLLATGLVRLMKALRDRT